jgi:hypothetical protein
MIFVGYILVAVGSIACFFGQIRLLAIAYRRGFGWLLSCVLLAPLCWLALLLVDFKSTVRPVALVFVGLAVAVGGGVMAGAEL